MRVRDFMGLDQVQAFTSRFCRVATPDEILAAGFDADEVLPEEKFYVLTVAPSQIFRIPGFGQFYRIQSQWRIGQVIHPWLL